MNLAQNSHTCSLPYLSLHLNLKKKEKEKKKGKAPAKGNFYLKPGEGEEHWRGEGRVVRVSHPAPAASPNH